jgi:phage terminase large subunit-like protein
VPRVRIVPDGDDRLGREVVDFMKEIGRPLDPWQADCVRCAFSLRPDGLWSAYELLVLVARQNGKGVVTEAIELGSMYLFHEPLLLHSAHQFKTSTAAFRRLQEIIDASDWLRRRVKMISRSKGDESIELTARAGGSRLQFVARTLGSGRGLTGSKNIFDEAAWLTVGQYAAQTPTLSTIPNPQIIYTSTPPDDDIGPLPEDAMLPSVRARALAGAPRVAMFEWSPAPGYDRSDPEVWYQTNPALGIRIQEWFLAQQLESFSRAGRPEKFDTEHLGAWPDDSTKQWLVVPEQRWMERRVGGFRLEDPVALGVDITPDRNFAAIGAAGRRASGGRGIELIEHHPGEGWVIHRLVELAERHKPCAVVTSDRALRDKAAEAGLTVHLAGAGDMASAAAMLYDGIAGSAPDIYHLGQPELTAAVAGAMKRPIGDAWAWDRRSPSTDICPLVAVSLALWGLATPRVHVTRLRPFALIGD